MIHGITGTELKFFAADRILTRHKKLLELLRSLLQTDSE